MTTTATPQRTAPQLDAFIRRSHIAYFSMEIAVRAEMHTYAGGLGVLAGDTLRSSADLELPMIFVTLASRAGYFRQEIDSLGHQVEAPDSWNPETWCVSLDARVAVRMDGRDVWIRPWLYVHTSPVGHSLPVLLLDSDLEQNRAEDRRLTDCLYGGDDRYRLKQEIILGIGGARLLRVLGFDPHTYHLNEGHSALLTLDLLKASQTAPSDQVGEKSRYNANAVRDRCVFTTHTPVDAGHDRFDYDMFVQVLPAFIDLDELKRHAGQDQLNLTRLALNLSGYVNGVASRHAQTTSAMFPGYRIHAVGNGVHAQTWANPAFAALYDAHMPRWRHEPEMLVRSLDLPTDDVWRCHQAGKSDLIRHVAASTGVELDPERHADALYDKLERTILPLWYREPERWRIMMKESIGRIASEFNSHRMMRRYAAEAYLR